MRIYNFIYSILKRSFLIFTCSRKLCGTAVYQIGFNGKIGILVFLLFTDLLREYTGFLTYIGKFYNNLTPETFISRIICRKRITVSIGCIPFFPCGRIGSFFQHQLVDSRIQDSINLTGYGYNTVINLYQLGKICIGYVGKIK